MRNWYKKYMLECGTVKISIPHKQLKTKPTFEQWLNEWQDVGKDESTERLRMLKMLKQPQFSTSNIRKEQDSIVDDYVNGAWSSNMKGMKRPNQPQFSRNNMLKEKEHIGNDETKMLKEPRFAMTR